MHPRVQRLERSEPSKVVEYWLDIEPSNHTPLDQIDLHFDEHRDLLLYFHLILTDSNRACVRITLSPFQNGSCSFTYHSYRIQVCIPNPLSTQVSVGTHGEITNRVQEVYDSLASLRGKYPFRFRVDESVSPQPRDQI